MAKRNSRYRHSTRITRGEDTYLGLRPQINTEKRLDDVYYDVVYGDTLPKVAHKAFGDLELWWIIADFNDIINPFEELEPGTTLRLPSRSRLYMELLV